MQEEVRKMEEESRQAKAAALGKQSRHLNWDGVQARKINWSEMWTMDRTRLSFLLKSVYDVLPSPTNLRTWGLAEQANCKLCGKPANLAHILSSCTSALKDVRYRWRHDRMLTEIAKCKGL